jgi:PAS domain-containing protein
VADDEYVADIEARFRECIERREPLEYVEQLPVPEEQSYWHTKIAPVVDDGTVVELVGATRDITERKKREQELRARRDELAQLHRLNTLVREIIQALQDTNTQDCIESAVCDRLTTSELYQAVWIGAPDWSRPAEVAIVPQTTAGLDEETLAELTAVDDPTLRALHTGEIQVVDDLAAADRLSETHRQALREHGCHALAAVPLSGENTSYGVLVVYLSDSHTISDAERDVLTDLGEILALAIQRVHSQRSLAGEAAVELEFRLPDADIAFGEVSATLDCELALERLVPTSDGAALAYHTVRGTEPGRMSEALAAMEGIGGCTVVREAEDGQSGLIETHLTDTSLFPATVLTEYGASVASARAVDGDVSFSAELAPEIDVRAVLDTIHETLPDVELTSKQLVDRSATTTPGVQQQLGDRLTPKQQATLEVAYSRGYYSWPRETTAQELADALDISAPTLHYRLRRAHQTVLQTLLESDAHDR